MTCAAPALNLDLLQAPHGRGRRRHSAALGHSCARVERACLWRRSGEEKDRSNSELVLPDGLSAVSAALRMRVRQVHVGHTQSSLRSMGFLRAAKADDPPGLSAPREWSACVPLIWWPVWGYNIGELWQNSGLPLAELLSLAAQPV